MSIGKLISGNIVFLMKLLVLMRMFRFLSLIWDLKLNKVRRLRNLALLKNY